MLRSTVLVSVCALAVVAAFPSFADSAGGAAGVELESTRVATIPSSVTDQSYRIHVALPYAYEASQESFPVVYLLDSDVLFGLVTDVTRLLALEGVPVFLGNQRVPESIVVGIGYPGGVGEMSNKRGRDMNPPEGENGQVNPLGAANFYRFLSEDLIPWVESNYRASADDRTLLGASRGGVFVLSTLFLHPESFRRYVAISPVIEPPLFEYLERFSVRERAPATRLFLSAGSAGEVEEGIAEGVSGLTKRLEKLASGRLRWSFESFEGETHVSVLPRALVRGLVSVFEREAPEESVGSEPVE